MNSTICRVILFFLSLIGFIFSYGQADKTELADNSVNTFNKNDLLQSLLSNKPFHIVLANQTLKLHFAPRSNFSNGLAARYPEIKSYVAQDGLYTVFIDHYQNQLSGLIYTGSQILHIQPGKTDHELMVARSKRNLQDNKTTGVVAFCKNQHTDSTATFSFLRQKKAAFTDLRTYRMALAITGEFAAKLGQTKSQIMAGLNNHLTRINALYIAECGIRFELVDKNDTLLFTDGNTDPYINGNVAAMLDRNPTVLNDRIGLANYDIGHVFGTNDGGVAQLSSVCTANKGAGASCAFGAYTDLNFYLIPAHEIGHQLSATHSFNKCDNSNETSSSAFEPGSGSTIMGYAGASNCGPNYIQDLSDSYFHSFSLQQIKNYSRESTGRLCGTTTAVNNNNPLVQINIPVNAFIPKATPFELSGKATDVEGSKIFYTWEEMDLGVSSILGMPGITSPLFRSILPDTVTTRLFPSLPLILRDSSSIYEVLPKNGRELKFRLTARDRDVRAGGSDWQELTLQVAANAGPFRINSFNRPDTVFRKQFVLLNWDIANTTSAPISANQVDLYWSDDGGVHFTLLLGRTPNDGMEWITIPDKATQQGRIKIKASNHVFFDINNANIVVNPSLPAQSQLLIQANPIVLCAGDQQSIPIISSPSQNEDTLKIIRIEQASTDLVFTLGRTFLVSEDTIPILIHAFPKALNGIHPVKVHWTVTGSRDTFIFSFEMRINSLEYTKLSPTDNEDLVTLQPIFRWNKKEVFDSLRLEVSTSPDFGTITWSKSVYLGDSSLRPDIEFNSNTVYHWRLRPGSSCAGINLPFQTFHTQSLDCKTYVPGDVPKFISATGTPRVLSTLNVTDEFPLAQISLPILRGTHDFIGDLSIYLKAPSGDSIQMWANECNNLSNYNLILDDQAMAEISCPLTDRKSHKPRMPFSNLVSSPSKGNWTLIVQDGKSGSGGSLDEWKLKLCGSFKGIGPGNVSNKGLEMFEQRKQTLTKNTLEYVDQNSSPNQLKFQFLFIPNGVTILYKNKDTIKLGSFFSQQDITDGHISISTGPVGADSIYFIKFIVTDELQNWSGIQQFKILVKDDPLLRISNTGPKGLLVYPNPFASTLRIINNDYEEYSGNLTDLNGKYLQTIQIKRGQNEYIVKTAEQVLVLIVYNVSHQIIHTQKLIQLW